MFANSSSSSHLLLLLLLRLNELELEIGHPSQFPINFASTHNKRGKAIDSRLPHITCRPWHKVTRRTHARVKDQPRGRKWFRWTDRERGELNDRQSRWNINSYERSSRSGIFPTEFYFHIKVWFGYCFCCVYRFRELILRRSFANEF